MMRAQETTEMARIEISAGAEWFRVDGGPVVVLETRIPLRRLLLALGELRTRTPNAVLPVTGAFEAGWPGERATPTAAAMRVYTAVHSLRRLGLRGMLVRRRRGYVLDAQVEVLAPESQIPPAFDTFAALEIPATPRAITPQELALADSAEIDLRAHESVIARAG